MTYAQIIEKRNKLMNDAGILAQGKHADGETRAKVTAMLVKADELAEQAKNAQRIESFQEEVRAGGRPPRGEFNGANELDQTKIAFRDWMRTGNIAPENRSLLREQRDLGAATGVGLGTNSITSSVLVPVGFDPLLATAQRSYGQLVGAVRNYVTAGGEPEKFATVDDTANALTLLTNEITAVTELDPSLGGGISYVDDLTTGLVKVSNNLLNDAAFSVSDFISETFGSRYYRGLAQMIQQGNGSHIASIAANVPVGATSATAAGIVLNDIINMFTALDPAYHDRASFVMSPAVKSALMQITDSYGRPLLQADISGTPFNALYGRPIVSSTYAPTIAPGNVPIIFGDLTSYTLRTVSQGLQIVRLSERYAEFNETGFIGRCRAGGYSTLQAASPAIVGLKIHA